MIKMQDVGGKSWRADAFPDTLVIAILDGMAIMQMSKKFSSVPRGFKVYRRRMRANDSFLRIDAWVGEQA